MSDLRLVVVSAGVTIPSSTRLLADRLGEATITALGSSDPVQIEVIELAELAGDIARVMVGGVQTAVLAAAVDHVTSADGLIVATPVFTASYSGLFKSFFDILDKDALTATPVVLAATGGTERHSLVLDHALRPLFAYLRAVVATTGVFAAPSDWGSDDPLTVPLPDRIARAGRELANLMRGGQVERSSRTVAAGLAPGLFSGVPFEQQLDALGVRPAPRD